MNDYYPSSEETVEKFTIKLTFKDEFLSPYDVYSENDEYGKEDIQNIIDGKYTWAIAVVTAYKNGIKLAKTTLGCCEYNPNNLIEDFKTSGEYESMKNEVLNEAKQTLKELLSRSIR